MKKQEQKIARALDILADLVLMMNVPSQVCSEDFVERFAARLSAARRFIREIRKGEQ